MHNNKDLEEMLRSDKKGLDRAVGTLSKMFRKMLIDMNFEFRMWNSHMAHFLKDPRNRIRQNPRDISSARGNLVKEFLRPSMTWPVFEKFIRFLNPMKARFVIELDTRDGKTLRYSTTFYQSDTEIVTPEGESVRKTPTLVNPEYTTEDLQKIIDHVKKTEVQ